MLLDYRSLSLILQAQSHKMNHFLDDSPKQSSGSLPVKEIEVPNDVGDMLEFWLNKAKESGDVL